MERTCRKECEGFSDSNPCADTLIDSQGTSKQYEAATLAISKLKQAGGSGKSGRVGTVDAFSLTKNKCAYTKDARHFKPLDGQIALEAVKELLAQAAPEDK